MNKAMRKFLVFIMLFVITATLAGGCGNDTDEELNRQIQMQITLLEDQVKGIEEHQENMRKLIRETQIQLNAMQEELNKEAPRIHAAGTAVSYLRDLTTVGFGESPAESTLRDPKWTVNSVLWLLLFVAILWLLYRYWYRGQRN